jgi:hypothetical protein
MQARVADIADSLPNDDIHEVTDEVTDQENIQSEIHISQVDDLVVEGTGKYVVNGQESKCSVKITLEDVKQYAADVGTIDPSAFIFMSEFSCTASRKLSKTQENLAKQLLFKVLNFVRNIRGDGRLTIVTFERKRVGFLQFELAGLATYIKGKNAMYMFINSMMKYLDPIHYREPARPPTPVFESDSDGGGKSKTKKNKTKKNKSKNKKSKKRWSLKYKKSINCKRPRGFSQRQYCKYGRKNLK